MLSCKLRGDLTFENQSVHPLRKLRGLKHDQRHHDCLKNKMLSKVKISQKGPPWFLMYEGQQQGKLIYDVRIVVILRWLGKRLWVGRRVQEKAEKKSLQQSNLPLRNMEIARWNTKNI